MNVRDSLHAFWRRSRSLGIAVLLLGVVALVTPLWAGEWTLAILGLAVSVTATIALVRTLLTRDARRAETRYVHAVAMLLVGFVLFYSPALVLRGVFVL